VAVLWNPANPANATYLTVLGGVAQKLGVKLQSEEVRDPGGFDNAFASMSARSTQALVVVVDPLTVRYRGRIAELAAKYRLPAMYGFREFADAGGLMAYGANVADLCRRAATYVDKILKGAKPADLPVEQPNKFELVINLKTAKALGLTIPQSLLQRADQVIE
jgi:putative ABC transport system substrate-binding protein